jgi:hypothetical protein
MVVSRHVIRGGNKDNKQGLTYVTAAEPITSPRAVPWVAGVESWAALEDWRLIIALSLMLAQVDWLISFKILRALTPEVNPYAKDHTTSPATFFAAVQQSAMIP